MLPKSSFGSKKWFAKGFAKYLFLITFVLTRLLGISQFCLTGMWNIDSAAARNDRWLV